MYISAAAFLLVVCFIFNTLIFFFRTLVLRGGPTRHEPLRKRVLSITNSDKWFGLRLRILLHEKLYDDVIFSGTIIPLLFLLFTLVF